MTPMEVRAANRQNEERLPKKKQLTERGAL
jgi:hypothetical protein